MSKDKKNINQIATRTATQWQARAKEDRTNRQVIKRAQAFALELMDHMDAHKIKQKELADRMNVSPQQVNKILRAKANLTFETIDKIADALGVTISSPTIETTGNIYSKTVGNTMQTVS